MVYQDYHCEVPPEIGIAHEPGAGVVYRTHVWQWVYVPQIWEQHTNEGGWSQDRGGALVGRCIYCGATWEESSDGD